MGLQPPWSRPPLRLDTQAADPTAAPCSPRRAGSTRGRQPRPGDRPEWGPGAGATLHAGGAEEAMLRTAAGQAGVDGGWEAAAMTSSTYLWT